MSQLSVSMTADEADLFAKLTTMIAKVAEGEAAFKKAGETSNAAAAASKAAAEQAEAVARAQAQLAKEHEAFANGGRRLAEQLLKSNETLEESYERQKTQIKAAHEAGKIGAKEHENALAVLQNKHEQAQEAQIKAAKEQAEAIQKVREAQERAALAQEKAALESSDSYRKNQKEIENGIALVDRLRVANTSLEDKYKQMAIEVTKAHQAGKITAEQHDQAIDQLKREYDGLNKNQETMGQKLESSFLSMVAGWGSVAVAVKLVTDAITFQNDQIQKGVDLVNKQDDPFKNLTTVSADRLELTERIMQSERLQTTEGMDAARAANMVFAMDSEGIIGKNKTIQENDAAVALFGNLNRFTNPETMVKVAGQMEKSFGMGVEESINMTLKAAETSKMTPSEMANQLALASAGASQFTGADQRDVAVETAAIVSGLTGVHGNRAGDIAKSAMMKLATAFPDATPMEAAKLANQMDAEARREMFGEDQQLTIFLSDIARGEERYAGLVGDVESATNLSGTAQSEIAKNLAVSDANPYSAQLRMTNAAKAREELAAKRKAMVGLNNQAAQADAMADIADGGGFTGNWLPDSVEGMLVRTARATADFFATPLQGSDRIETDIEREKTLRSQVGGARLGLDPSMTPQGLPGSDPEAERRHQETLRALMLQNQPTPTRPGDDR
jgi:hypothetical protein